jgi:diphosphomevalonate decarboxylase
MDRIRELAGANIGHAKVLSMNNFPTATGLSSSASGFAALTIAAVNAAGLRNLRADQISALARKGSGSACRSIPDGIVEWKAHSEFAESIFPPDHWPELRDIVVIVNTERKEVSSSTGHRSTWDNPFFEVRKAHMPQKNSELLNIITRKDFHAFGRLAEQEALELHAMMLTSGLIYLQPGTIEVMRFIKYKLRPLGIPVYFTLNTGQDIHLLCLENDVDTIVSQFDALGSVRDIYINKIGVGARETDHHLF